MNPNDLQMLIQMLGRYGNQSLPGRAGPPGPPSAPSAPSSVNALEQYKAIMQMLAAQQNPQMMNYVRQLGPGGMPAMANQLKPYTAQPAHGSWADYAPKPPPPAPTPYPGSVAPPFVGGYRGVAPPINYGGWNSARPTRGLY